MSDPISEEIFLKNFTEKNNNQNKLNMSTKISFNALKKIYVRKHIESFHFFIRTGFTVSTIIVVEALCGKSKLLAQKGKPLSS